MYTVCKKSDFFENGFIVSQAETRLKTGKIHFTILVLHLYAII